MNSSSKYALVFIIIGGIIIASIAGVIYINSLKKSGGGDDDDDDGVIGPPPNSKKRVNIYVDTDIDQNITAELDQYKQDIIAQGYIVKVFIWDTNDITQDAVVLRTNLTYYYSNSNLVGAILIGDLPYIIFQDQTWPDPYGPYPCDLFLMDLDGSWIDNFPMPPGDGIYDLHNANPGQDLQPEIWVARINPYALSGVNRTILLKEYFKRNHEYRTNQLNRPHKGLLYIDDNWSRWVNEWKSNFTAYTGANVDCQFVNKTTTAANYKNNLTRNDIEFVHLLVHSNESDHLFKMDPIKYPPIAYEGYVNTMDIFNLDTQPLFYNLYACYSCDYSYTNNTGTQYLFSNNTLTVIGSARSGGMDLYQPFYDTLNQHKTLGEAFYTWFNNNDPLTVSKWTQKLWYGMTILGDPLLTIEM